MKKYLNANDKQTWMDTIWSSLHAYRQNFIPEGNVNYDSEWDDICTAMAWLEEKLVNCPHE